jgi:hypothetical protein
VNRQSGFLIPFLPNAGAALLASITIPLSCGGC